ncbi:DHA2 family efflux MFS transporter permease subunit [Citricoccus sp. SGAir0253]|uniref:MDR family MFS transporter n=1 Tax=Citricoccus sp. SGAir0253 TaxID=2567881 RepID=UPI0010CD4DAA|nr:MDR family MFS transporter [Citricoccus sp. SGAir0253]QCU79067.1 DHA2 family efflux MFS transporter permease subunit [Citricoccus sp. SGAir0253]
MPTAPAEDPQGDTTESPRAGTAVPAGASRVIALLVAAAFVVILNETVMSVALPRLMHEFTIGAATAQWMTTAFMLTMAVVIPVTGYLLTRLPLRTVFTVAMVSFLLGTLLAAVAPTFLVLVAGRVVQAVGTAIMMPLLFTTVLTVVPAHRRGRTMGVISIVIAVAPATGPTIGGIILDALDWRWMFWLMLPIAALSLALGVAMIRNVTETQRVPLDVLSVVLSALGFAGLVFGLSSIGAAAEGDALLPPWIALAVGVAALAAFTWRQAGLRDHALLDVRAFRVPAFSVALGMMVIGMMALFGTLIVLPIYLQEVVGASTRDTGLALLPGGLVMGVMGLVVGRLFDRLGARPLVVPGTVVVAAALWGMTTLTAASPVALLIVWHVLLNAGLSLMFSPLMTAALGALPRRLYSHGSAIMSTLQQVAGAAGTALFITVMTMATIAGASAHTDPVVALMDGIHGALVWGAVISLLAVAGSFLVRSAPAAEESPAPVPQPVDA